MHIYPQDDAKSDMLEAELWPTLPDSYTSIRKITIYVKSIVSAYMERSAHAWGAAQPQHICALRAAAQRTALRTKWELQTAHAVPAVCSALYAARAAPHARCAPYLRSYIPCVLRCMYATRHTVLHAPAGPQRSAAPHIHAAHKSKVP